MHQASTSAAAAATNRGAAPVAVTSTKTHKVAPGAATMQSPASGTTPRSGRSGGAKGGGSGKVQQQQRSFHDHYRVLHKEEGGHHHHQQQQQQLDSSEVGRGKYSVVKTVVKLDDTLHLLSHHTGGVVDRRRGSADANSSSCYIFRSDGSSEEELCADDATTTASSSADAGGRLHSADSTPPGPGGITPMEEDASLSSWPSVKDKKAVVTTLGSSPTTAIAIIAQQPPEQQVVLAAKFISRCSEGFNPEEGETLRSLSHPNIVPVVDILSYNSPPTSVDSSSQQEEISPIGGVVSSAAAKQVLIMPLIEGGELFKLASTPDNLLPESRAAHYVFQMLDAMSYLHDKGIVHRDIKLENVLVSFAPAPASDSFAPASGVQGGSSASSSPAVSSVGRSQQHSPIPAPTTSAGVQLHTPATTWGNIQLIDFGFSKQLSDPSDRSLTNCCGSPNYMSPEMLRASNQNHGLRSSGSSMAGSAGAAFLSSPLRASSNPRDSMAADGGVAVGALNTTPPSLSSPALPSKHGRYGVEVDTWAVGVSLYVLLFGQYPFYDERRSQWHKKILEGRWAPPPAWRSEGEVSVEVLDLISRLLDPNFSTRWTAAEALGHPWFEMHGLVYARDAHHQPLAPTSGATSTRTTPPKSYVLPSASSYATEVESEVNSNNASTPSAAVVAVRSLKKSPRLGTVLTGTAGGVMSPGNSSTPPSLAISCTHTSALVQGRGRGESLMSTSSGAAAPSAAAAAGGGSASDIHNIAFTPPRNTHRLGDPSPYSGSGGSSIGGGNSVTKESPF